jgi:crossover junction endodeoxyribonuclease RusA
MTATPPVTFHVYGVAAPKGSTKAFPIRRRNGHMGAVVTEANPHTRPWVSAVTLTAQAAVATPGVLPFPAPLPVSLTLAFALPRPTSLPKKIIDHCKKPDLDKLARAVKDALSGVLWTDDAQVVALACRKRYCQTGEMPHVVVTAERVEGTWM